MMTYKEAALDYLNNPRDVHTVLKDGSIGHWFYVHTENGVIYVTPAESHTPSSRITYPIRLNETEYDTIYAIYQKRKQGKPVSSEATKATRAQVYWFGVFSEIGL